MSVHQSMEPVPILLPPTAVACWRSWFWAIAFFTFGVSCSRADLDGDGDGFTELTNDCDDTDPNIHPDATEVCGNGKDDNCNGEMDELGATSGRVWYADVDGDGYGTDAYTVESCARPEGYVERKWDCDEGNPLINPAAAEICDGEDNDCDDEVDESTAVDAITWYPDRDGDGFGDDTVAVTACTAPEGHVPLPGDCNDVDPLTHPDQLEDCRTVGDDDCDGTANGAVGDAVGCTPFYADLDGDGFAGSAMCLCEPAEPHVSDIQEDCDDTDALVYPGATATRRWGSEDCDDTSAVELTAADVDLVEFVGTSRLQVVAGDRNADGATDLLFIGSSGSSLVVDGPLVGATDAETFHLPGSPTLSGAGRVSWVPDLNGDGIAELIALHAGYDDINGVYLFDGNPTEGETHADALAAATETPPAFSNGRFAARDLDGDGAIEVVYGDSAYRPVLGILDPSGATTTSDWDSSLLTVEGPSSTVPQAIFADIDGDGVEELLLGQMTTDVNYRTLGLWGNVNGSVTVFEVTEDRTFLPRVVYYGEKFLGSLGMDVADVDGDGHVDLIAGDSSNILEDDSWQILGFTGPIELDSSGVRAEVGWEAEIRVSGGVHDRLGNFDLLPDLDGDGADGLMAYAQENGPWYIRRLEAGHHRITEVGRATSTDIDGRPLVGARGLSNVDGSGRTGAAIQFLEGGYLLVPRLYIGDLP